MAVIDFSTDSMEDYRQFIRVRQLPSYRISGHTATFPDEYASCLLGKTIRKKQTNYEPSDFLFDYQRDISSVAIRKQKYAVFADCGLGKTLILLEFAKHCASVLPRGKKVLILSPLMVVPQTLQESSRWYGGKLPIDHIPSSGLQSWLSSTKGRVGITNYEAARRNLRRAEESLCSQGNLFD